MHSVNVYYVKKTLIEYIYTLFIWKFERVSYDL